MVTSTSFNLNFQFQQFLFSWFIVCLLCLSVTIFLLLCLSVCLSPSLCFSVSQFVCLTVCFFLSLYFYIVFMSVCLSICLSVCLHFSAFLSLGLSACISLYVCLVAVCLFVCLYLQSSFFAVCQHSWIFFGFFVNLKLVFLSTIFCLIICTHANPSIFLSPGLCTYLYLK